MYEGPDVTSVKMLEPTDVDYELLVLSIYKDILDEVSSKVSELKTSGWDPKLISIKVGENPAADLYIRNQRLKAEKVGIIFEEKDFPHHISTNELQAAITNFNVDPIQQVIESVSAIINDKILGYPCLLIIVSIVDKAANTLPP